MHGHSRLLPQPGQPAGDYEHVSISELVPSRRRVSFTGRIVNLYQHRVHSEKIPESAKGCMTIWLQDDVDGALILVNLCYDEVVDELHLGGFVTIWTDHVSSSTTTSAVHAVGPASLMTTIFLERDASCHLGAMSNDDHSVRNEAFGQLGGKRPVLGLMSLKAFIEGGCDAVPNAKVLVCVKAIGKVLAYTSKQSHFMPTISVTICDESAEAELSLSRPLIPSTKHWRQYETTLLISSPVMGPNRTLIVTMRTLLEIDPPLSEAASLRRWAQRQNCPINEQFPVHLFDVDTAFQAPLRIQFTFASLDSLIRASPSCLSTGFISVILTKLNLVSLWKRQQLFSMQCYCCGTPAYANTNRSSRCGTCGTNDINLRVNPNLVAEMADETGSISSCGSTTAVIGEERGSNYHPPTPTQTSPSNEEQRSKLLWRDEAWTQLLGRTPEDLVAQTSYVTTEGSSAAVTQGKLKLMRYLEQRLLFMRVILFIGSGYHLSGRLAIIRVVG